MNKGCGKDWLIAIGGLSGSGKSTLARSLTNVFSSHITVTSICTDVVRKELWGVSATQKLPPEAYTPAFNEKTYAETSRRIDLALEKGGIVIADAVFATEYGRSCIEKQAILHKRPFTGVWLQASADILRQRADARKNDPSNPSDADRRIVDIQLTYDLGDVSWHRLDASEDTASLTRQTLKVLAHCGLAP